MTQFAPVPGDLPGRPEAIAEMHVLWLTAGLGCDGDTIAVTGASQPSIEDIVLGAFPWIPKVHFHNPFLAYENGDEFVQFFRDAAGGKLAPFIFVVEGSIPNEHNKPLSAKTGQGMAEFLEFLEERRRNRQAVALSPVLPVR